MIKLDGLLKKLDKNEYRFFKKLPVDNVQRKNFFDYVIVSSYGVFIIDTIEQLGTVYGDEDDKYWKVYTKNRGIIKFDSPIQRNYKKITAFLKNITEIDPECFHSIFVFPNKSELNISIDSAAVAKKDRLISTLEGFEEKMVDSLRFNYLVHLFELYKSNKKNLPIPKLFKKEEKKINLQTCPLCNSHLVYKESEFGDYFICSSFPDCRYRQEV